VETPVEPAEPPDPDRESLSAEWALAVDGHVHLRRCFRPASFLEHAAANLTSALAALDPSLEASLLGVLLLAETKECHPFDDLQESGAVASETWSLAPTGEPESLLATHCGGTRLVLVAGRQIATREGLEVLSLGCRERIDPGLSVEATIDVVRKNGAIAVLPWGFGKWWGRRGTIVRRIVASTEPGGLYLGDNGNRSWLGTSPRLFREAEARGIHILPGSDPLPFPTQVETVGRYGFALTAPFDLENPAARIKELLRGSSTPLSVIGRLEAPHRLVSNQLRLRLRGWRR
jgi:hypothetical protein